MSARRIGIGFVGWAMATIALRFWGQHVLVVGDWGRTVALFIGSAFLMAFAVRQLLVGGKSGTDGRFQAAFLIMLPTFLFDPFTSAFFPIVFPNMDPRLAGTFGGWMLMSCTGALLGAVKIIKRSE